MKEKRKDRRGRTFRTGEDQMPDGRYRFRYTNGCGRQRAVYSWRLLPSDRTPAGTRPSQSLREKEQVIKKDRQDGLCTEDGEKETLDQLFARYMEDKPELKSSTSCHYRYLYRRYVSGRLGQAKIGQIRYSDIKSFYHTILYEQALSPGTVKNIHNILHPLFDLAVRDGKIKSNPTEGVLAELRKKGKWQKCVRRALSIEEETAFLSFLRESEQYKNYLPMFTVFLGTGCRVGELAALRWDDCDWQAHSLRIRRSLSYRPDEDGHCRAHITTPKTDAACRLIPMLPEVENALCQQKVLQKEQGTTEVCVDGCTGFIFVSQSQTLYRSETINRLIKRIMAAYNRRESARAGGQEGSSGRIRPFSVHNLRHTFCARFCENESNVKLIAEVMGHRDVSTTLNIYAQIDEEKKKETFFSLSDKILPAAVP